MSSEILKLVIIISTILHVFVCNTVRIEDCQFCNQRKRNTTYETLGIYVTCVIECNIIYINTDDTILSGVNTNFSYTNI